MISLPEDDPDLFEDYVQWINTDVICDQRYVSSGSTKRLVRLYILADKLGTTKLKNDCIDLIRATQHRHEVRHSGDSCMVAFEYTPAKSKLREYMIDSWVYWGPSKSSELEEYPSELFHEVLRRLFAKAAKDDKGRVIKNRPISPAMKKTCYYHEHDAFAPPCNGRAQVSGTREKGV